MPRLLRPHIPVETRCRVVLRQLGEMFPDRLMREWRATTGYGILLDLKLCELSSLLNCSVSDLHLDHNPALGAREKVFRKGEHVGYKPDANDPEHLIYREAAAHRIKTNVRGEHGQHPDRVLIKKQRRRERAEKGVQPFKRHVAFRGKNKVKPKWPTRPLRSASRWPKGRKIERKL